MSTDLLASWPVDTDATGDPVPPIGSIVAARRVSDGLRRTGLVDDNRGGTFLSGESGRHALTSCLWEFAVLMSAPVSERTPTDG